MKRNSRNLVFLQSRIPAVIFPRIRTIPVLLGWISRLLALRKASYDEFILTQDILNEYGIPDPSHTINYGKDGLIYVSLDWSLSDAQANQLTGHNAKQLLGVDDFKTDEQNVHIEGVAPDGAKLTFVANDYDNNFGLSIERIYKDAQLNRLIGG